MKAVEGILLAAGESRRMGALKPLLRIGASSYVSQLCAAMLTTVPHLTVVLGFRAKQIRAALPPDPRISVAVNSDFTRGQLSSLKAGLRTVAETASAVMVHLVDHPLVRRETFEQMVASYDAHPAAILVARYGSRRGHPVIFDRLVFAELLGAPEDKGARAVVDAEPARVAYLDVADQGITIDLDTPEDVARAGLAPPALKQMS